jgi:5-methylcytosine-specific restriction endonuclease McrA
MPHLTGRLFCQGCVDRKAARRKRWIASGVCHRCGNKAAVPGKGVCHGCAGKLSEWRKENADWRLEYNRAFREKFPLTVRAHSFKRRKTIKTGHVSAEDLNFIFSSQGGKCVVCRETLGEYHVDHIVPLALGGEHSKHNVQLLCPKCNGSKGAKHPIDFMQSIGMLL